MKLQNGNYVTPDYTNAINQLIWSSIENNGSGISKKINYITLLDLVLGLGFILDNGIQEEKEMNFDEEDKQILEEIRTAVYKLHSKYDCSEYL